MKKKKKKSPKQCDPGLCDHCTYIGGGDFLCDRPGLDEPVLVMDEWEPTEHYMECGKEEK